MMYKSYSYLIYKSYRANSGYYSITMAASFNSPEFSRSIAAIAGAFQNTPGGQQPNSQPLEQIHSLHLQQEELLGKLILYFEV